VPAGNTAIDPHKIKHARNSEIRARQIDVEGCMKWEHQTAKRQIYFKFSMSNVVACFALHYQIYPALHPPYGV
jgi:hypothetical protein